MTKESNSDDQGRSYPGLPFIDRGVMSSASVTMQLEPFRGHGAGPTLAELRERLGGSDHGEFREPWYGTNHPVDLRPWADLPPETRFRLRYQYQPSMARPKRGLLLIDALLSAAMPRSSDTAATLDELINRPIETEVVGGEGKGSANKAYLRSARQAFEESSPPISRRRIRTRLTAMVAVGRVHSRGKGSKADPLRFWLDPSLGIPSNLRPATQSESEDVDRILRHPK